ncbi:MAG: site-specific DNA-methyltransferase [Defluviitaleaceae bacterium]|nr:site-specific DNA-methyltransferase [Defluviitaleaceae bacterium]
MRVDIPAVKKRIYDAKATNRNPIYNTHLYWSQKPYNICDILIESFSEEGDTVFDPFLGSGVTLLQAVSSTHKRKAIGCEINEAPLFIVKTLLKSYDEKKYKKTLDVFLREIKKLQRYYAAQCPYCNEVAFITSVVFDKATRNAEIEIKDINFRCVCSPKGTKTANSYDYDAINIEYTPKNIIDTVLIPNSRIAVHENETISCIFTKRNFAVLDEVVGVINTLEMYQDLFRYILMSVLHLCKITDKRSNSQWPLWIPKNDCVEKNIINLLEKKAKKFTSAISYRAEHYKNPPDHKLLHKGSQNIDEVDIPNNSVDLIITDPPYLGQVLYSEYMQLYKPFLGLDFNLDDEIVVSNAPSRDKSELEYFDLLDRVFGVCASKLKESAYFCLYFHDSNLEVWNKLISSLTKHHLRYISQAHIPKSNTIKNIISPKKSLNGDCILFFVKDSGVVYNDTAAETLNEIVLNIVQQAKHLLKQHKTLSTPELYDNGIMEVLIQNGWLPALAKKYKTLVDIFEKHLKWDSTISKWTA